MANMGAFINEFDAKLLAGVAVFVVMAAPIFGYFFNRLMNRLREGEHTSYYVVIGVAVTLALGALISWKSALLMAGVFVLTGLPMIVGEFQRTEKKTAAPRRKRLPYAANGLLDQAGMAGAQAHRMLGQALAVEDAEKRLRLIAVADHEISSAILSINAVKQIQEK